MHHKIGQKLYDNEKAPITKNIIFIRLDDKVVKTAFTILIYKYILFIYK